jgi:hypothetical protein
VLRPVQSINSGNHQRLNDGHHDWCPLAPSNDVCWASLYSGVQPLCPPDTFTSCAEPVCTLEYQGAVQLCKCHTYLCAAASIPKCDPLAFAHAEALWHLLFVPMSL